MAKPSNVETLPTKPRRIETAGQGDGRDITRGFIDPMLVECNPDSVLQQRGRDLRVYEEIKRDSQVKSVLEQRRLAVVQAPWRIEPGGDSPVDIEAAEYAQEQCDRVGFDRVTDLMLWGLFYGYSVSELIWRPDGARWGWESIKVRDRRRFGFLPDGELRLLTMADQLKGEPAEAPYFWHFAAGADHSDQHYGLGLGHWLYWPVFFKRHGLKFWSVFVEKFAAPTVLGKFPGGTPDADVDLLLDACQAVGLDAAVTIPEDMNIELVEAARAGHGGTYGELIEVMDKAISKAVLSQTMTTDDGSSLSQSKTHAGVKNDLVVADSDLVAESFRCGPLTWLTRFNFAGAEIPILAREVEPPEDQNAAAERDERLANIGWIATEGRITEIYGEGYERKPEPVPPAVLPPGQIPAQPPQDDPSAEFAENPKPRPATVAESYSTELELATMGATDKIVDAIRRTLDQFIDGGRDLAEFGEYLGSMAAWSQLDEDELGALVAQAMAAAELAGMNDAEGE